jgi:hypothetical protein
LVLLVDLLGEVCIRLTAEHRTGARVWIEQSDLIGCEAEKTIGLAQLGEVADVEAVLSSGILTGSRAERENTEFISMVDRPEDE